MVVLPKPHSFQWDEGNRDKNFFTHGVTNQECEEVFFDEQKKILKTPLRTDKEERYIVVGKTQAGRLLFVVFTLRGEEIRVISARDINKKERRFYEEQS